jgi:hypothetical protein
MSGNWYSVKEHSRKYTSGRIGWVRNYYWREYASVSSESNRKRRSNTCPYCRAVIHTMPMAKGGWAHFENGLVHLGTLHPCFTIGRGMSKRPSENMRDLFEQIEE